MTLLFDKHQLIVSPGPAPTQLGAAEKIGRRQDAQAALTIGLINNMPDSALQATERQFMRLLKAAGATGASSCTVSRCHPLLDRSRRGRASTGNTPISPISAACGSTG